MNKRMTLRALTEGAVMVALSMGLDFAMKFIPSLPQGGSITLGMIPILFYAMRWGVGQGILCGFVYGILQMILDGAYAWGWQSLLLDYLVAYAALGLGGLFRPKKPGFVYADVVLGCVARFLVHFFSGVTIYRITEPTEVLGMTFLNPYTYSLVYNGSYMGISMILTIIVFVLLWRPMGKFIRAEDLKKS